MILKINPKSKKISPKKEKSFPISCITIYFMVLFNIMKPPEILQRVDPDGQARRVFNELEEAAIEIHTRKRSLVRHFDAGDRRVEFSY